MDPPRSFGVDDRDDDTSQQAKRDEPFFAVTEAIVLIRKGRSFEYFSRIDEVEAMILQIRFALSLMPREPHMRSVYTTSARVNPSAEAA